MLKLPEFDTPIQQFLRQPVIDLPYVYLDRWSAVHFCSGLALGAIFAAYFPKKFSWLIVLGILVAYEVFEVLADGVLFVPETMTDKAWDLAIGMAGFFAAQLAIKIIKKIYG